MATEFRRIFAQFIFLSVVNSLNVMAPCFWSCASFPNCKNVSVYVLFIFAQTGIQHKLLSFLQITTNQHNLGYCGWLSSAVFKSSKKVQLLFLKIKEWAAESMFCYVAVTPPDLMDQGSTMWHPTLRKSSCSSCSQGSFCDGATPKGCNHERWDMDTDWDVLDGDGETADAGCRDTYTLKWSQPETLSRKLQKIR